MLWTICESPVISCCGLTSWIEDTSLTCVWKLRKIDGMSDPLSVHTAFFTASSSACFRAFQWLSLPLCRTRKNDSTISFKHLPKTSEEKHLSNRATALTSKSYTSKIRDFLISETCWTPNPTIFQHHPRLSTAFCSARISAASPSWVPEVSP